MSSDLQICKVNYLASRTQFFHLVCQNLSHPW